jgi:hypothetical protein
MFSSVHLYALNATVDHRSLAGPVAAIITDKPMRVDAKQRIGQINELLGVRTLRS